MGVTGGVFVFVLPGLWRCPTSWIECVTVKPNAAMSGCVQGAMSELFISRVFEEHVAPRRGATWPPPKRQQSGSGSDGGSSSPCSPSRKPSSLPAISGTSPPRSPASKPLAATGSSRQQQQQQGKIAGRWPPPLPPGAACARDEMDLLAFATFVLAWDHRNQAAAIPYFFKIFDINHRVRNKKTLLLQVFELCVVPAWDNTAGPASQ